MTVKVNELKKVRENIQGESKGTETIEFHELSVNVKKYLPVAQKISMARDIYDMATEEENGVVVVNRNSINIATVYFVIDEYTDVNLPKDVVEAVDLILEIGLFPEVYKVAGNDIDNVNTMVENIIKKENEKLSKQKELGYVIEKLLGSMQGVDFGTLVEGIGLNQLGEIKDESK